jgi:hypothetical protein
LNFFENSADAWILPGKDNYFNNQKILKQFDRLFKLLQFKKEFEGHEIEILVDNATTHTAKNYDINHFNKKPGTKCAYRVVEWTEDGINRQVFCHDEQNNYKGLAKIIEEMGLRKAPVNPSLTLKELRDIMLEHPVFNENNTKL